MPQGPRAAVCQCPWGSTASIPEPQGQESSLKDSLQASLQCSIFPFRAKCWQTAENPQALHVFSLSLNMLLLQNKIFQKIRVWSFIHHCSLVSHLLALPLQVHRLQAKSQISAKAWSTSQSPSCATPKCSGEAEEWVQCSTSICSPIPQQPSWGGKLM